MGNNNWHFYSSFEITDFLYPYIFSLGSSHGDNGSGSISYCEAYFIRISCIFCLCCGNPASFFALWNIRSTQQQPAFSALYVCIFMIEKNTNHAWKYNFYNLSSTFSENKEKSLTYFKKLIWCFFFFNCII